MTWKFIKRKSPHYSHFPVSEAASWIIGFWFLTAAVFMLAAMFFENYPETTDRIGAFLNWTFSW